MPRLATAPDPARWLAQPATDATTSRTPQVRAKLLDAERGLTTSRGISPPSYISLSDSSGGDAVRQQPDGEREEIRLVPAQDGAEIRPRGEGRPARSSRAHDALARLSRRYRRHLPAPRFAGAPAD